MALSLEGNDYTLDKSLVFGHFFMSIISLIFSLLMSLFIIFDNKLRSLSYIILCCIGISETLQSLGFALSIFKNIVNNPEFFCLSSQIFIIFSDSCTMLFLCLLSYYTFSLVIKNNREIYQKKKFVILIGFIGGSVYATIIFILHYVLSREETGHKWCQNNIKVMGIVNIETKILGSSIPYYAINWIMVLFISLLYLKIKIHLKERSMEDPVNACKIMAICHNLAYYPMLGFLGWGVTTFFLFPLAKDDHGPLNHLKLMVMYLGGIFICLRGFLISLFFFTSDKIWSIIKLRWKLASKPLSNINFLQFNTQNSSSCYDQTLI